MTTTQQPPYDATYYARQVDGALRSARRIVPLLQAALQPASVIDVGCGQGAWLRAWIENGVSDVLGLDGSYTSLGALQFPVDRFTIVNLASPFEPSRRFALAQSLEVAEHLPPESAEGFVSSLVAAAPVILFSAAVPGQGGESHVNEQPLEFWRLQFARHYYHAFDCVRPQIRYAVDIEPWYRFNTVLYVREDHIDALSAAIAATRVPVHAKLREGGDARWWLRRSLVRWLPRGMVDLIARALAARAIRNISAPGRKRAS